MNVALVEICELNHYMVTNALIKTYLELPGSKIHVFTNKKIYEILKSNESFTRVKFIVQEELESEEEFLHKLYNFDLDRIHLCTVSKYFKAFIKSLPAQNVLLFFHFHNIELWFGNIFKGQSVSFLSSVRNNYSFENIFKQFVWSVKEISRHGQRKKLIQKITQLNTYYIALSEVQKELLSNYIEKRRIIIFPSLINDSAVLPEFITQTKIRVCIPGSVSDSRRDYTGFFELVQKNFDFFKQHIILDLLGYFPVEEKKLLQQAEEFRERGFDILFYRDYLSPDAYDENLYKADIILSNLLIQLSKNGKGQIKETAAVYNMIRGSKPGLFPSLFTLDSELRPSVLSFNDYPDLLVLFNKLIADPSILFKLKKNAVLISKQYTTGVLIRRLIELPA